MNLKDEFVFLVLMGSVLTFFFAANQSHMKDQILHIRIINPDFR
ncbi:hypothetical protein VVMO6_04263 [Vibrio vulnificus MO6-24/O]|nr:hypothetical protein VVMO6_04263 [Vibrio vulnificus MO6-24/O]